MFKRRVIFIIAVLAFAAASCSEPAPTGTTINVSFTGPAVSPSTVYCLWLEDESGRNLQNLYVCNRVVDIGGGLLGDALPNWKTKKYPDNSRIDGVTGASTQKSKTVSRSLNAGSVKRFRVCFEIDRSRNGNAYFTDRPAFTYATEFIDLDSLKPEYPLSLIGWMANDTDGTPYGQQPQQAIPGFQQYLLMADTSYVEDSDGSTADMVDSATAAVVKN